MKNIGKIAKFVLGLIVTLTYGLSPIWTLLLVVTLIASILLKLDYSGPHVLASRIGLFVLCLLSFIAADHAYGGQSQSTTEPPPPEPKTRP